MFHQVEPELALGPAEEGPPLPSALVPLPTLMLVYRVGPASPLQTADRHMGVLVSVQGQHKRAQRSTSQNGAHHITSQHSIAQHSIQSSTRPVKIKVSIGASAGR
jgi:hypothetical protein